MSNFYAVIMPSLRVPGRRRWSTKAESAWIRLPPRAERLELSIETILPNFTPDTMVHPYKQTEALVLTSNLSGSTFAKHEFPRLRNRTSVGYSQRLKKTVDARHFQCRQANAITSPKHEPCNCSTARSPHSSLSKP